MNADNQLSKLKAHLTQRLMAIDRVETLEAIKLQMDLVAPQVDFWDELAPLEREAILEGLTQVEAGHYRPYREVLDELKK